MKWVKNFKKAGIITLIGLLNIHAVFAYIDPGTGGALLGSIWPFIVSIFAVIAGFFVKVFFKPIKNTFSRMFKRKY